MHELGGVSLVTLQLARLRIVCLDRAPLHVIVCVKRVYLPHPYPRVRVELRSFETIAECEWVLMDTSSLLTNIQNFYISTGSAMQ